MSSRSLSLTVFLYRFAGAVLLTAAFTSACGSGASPGGPIGGGGTGGIASSAGGTTTGVCGTTPVSGGTTGTPATPEWGTPVTGGPTGTGTTATVTVNPSTTVGTIGADFTGFSYEDSDVHPSQRHERAARPVAFGRSCTIVNQ